MDRRILLADFARAVQRLTNALSTPAQSDLEKAGGIQYFEFCFELAWKNVRLAAERQGLGDGASPRAALKQAFALRWLDNEVIAFKGTAVRMKIVN